ncbi:MAG: hypothetical protein ACM3ZA_06280 [Bacillota bacterium]
MTQHRALRSALQRLRGVLTTVKALVVERVEEGGAVSQGLIDLFWQLKDVEQSLSAVVLQGSDERQAG